MEQLTKKEFTIFKEATSVLDKLKLDYVVFGGIAVWAYGRQRATKDIDLLINSEDADEALIGLLKAGWTTTRTDEAWLYQAQKGGVQVDLIFQAKGDFALTKEISQRALWIEISGLKFKVISPEDLILIKIHALKEIRPADWYDAISVLNGVNGKVNWNYIIDKARLNPKRVLSFLLFAQAESEINYVPDWVIENLVRYVFPKAA